MKVEELLVLSDEDCVTAISFVEDPAIKENLLYFNQESIELSLAAIQDEEQRIVVSPCLVPNKLILRQDKETGEYFQVYFSKDTVKKSMESYQISNSNRYKVDHKNNVSDIYMLENWIVENETDKINTIYGYKVPVGTWCASFKINNDFVWSGIKTGKYKGLSIEGKFVNDYSMEAEKNDDFSFMTKIKEIILQNDTDESFIEEIKKII